MPSRVTEIAADTYRISTFHPEYGIQFNQFLIRDEEPFLMHTGFRRMFASTLEGVKTLIDPATLRWIGFSHFEADECGALNQWLAVAPRAQAICSMVGAMVSLTDYADRAPRGLEDEEVLAIGRHRLRFLATPHVPHSWDSGSIPGKAVPRASPSGPLAHDMPYTPYTDSTLQRLAALGPKVLAVMHGSSFRGDGARAVRDLAVIIKECLG